jgi:Na+/pantothenate symporter
VEASNQCAKRERKGPVIIDDKGAMTLLHKLQMRIEQFVQKLSDWDGRTELSILVPFAETILMDSEMIGGTKLVDTSKSRPYVNGLYLIVRHSQNGS